jgi:hypothetical protein
MQNYTADELRSTINTAHKLQDVAASLAARDSKEYRDAAVLADIVHRLHHAAVILETDPEGAELALISIIRPLQTA